MLKLQRLQQKAILDDDYDAGELFVQMLLRLVRHLSCGWTCHFRVVKRFIISWLEMLSNGKQKQKAAVVSPVMSDCSLNQSLVDALSEDQT